MPVFLPAQLPLSHACCGAVPAIPRPPPLWPMFLALSRPCANALPIQPLTKRLSAPPGPSAPDHFPTPSCRSCFPGLHHQLRDESLLQWYHERQLAVVQVWPGHPHIPARFREVYSIRCAAEPSRPPPWPSVHPSVHCYVLLTCGGLFAPVPIQALQSYLTVLSPDSD